MKSHLELGEGAAVKQILRTRALRWEQDWWWEFLFLFSAKQISDPLHWTELTLQLELGRGQRCWQRHLNMRGDFKIFSKLYLVCVKVQDWLFQPFAAFPSHLQQEFELQGWILSGDNHRQWQRQLTATWEMAISREILTAFLQNLNTHCIPPNPINSHPSAALASMTPQGMATPSSPGQSCQYAQYFGYSRQMKLLILWIHTSY